MIDTHCHLTFKPLYEQLDVVLSRAREAGVDRMISVGTSPDDAQLALSLAHQHENLFATVGIHPHYAAPWTDHASVTQAIQPLMTQPGIVALGEMGLDRHYDQPTLEVQQRVFHWQLAMAKQSSLPIIIHNREATDDVLAMIRESGIDGSRFVFHCFTGSDAELSAILDLGAMVSFTGIVTFKNAGDLAKSAHRVPMDRIMVETDSPYLTPHPHRKVHPNQPSYVPYVAKFLAASRGMSHSVFIEQADANAVRFFNLPAKCSVVSED